MQIQLQSLIAGTQGLTLLFQTHRDRLFYALVIVVLLGASSWVAALAQVLRATMGHTV